ncbi:MAG: GntR family transcriptional regulator [Clostridiales bacterium]|nr:GntR family transcriptional regulator [Clostridiales bacterium]
MTTGERAPIVTDRQTIQDNIYATLRGQICLLELTPGIIMSSNEVAESMSLLMHRSVSRTPVREAFIRLAKEGLVSMLPQHGTVVTRIDPQRAMEEQLLRYTLETANLEDFQSNASTADYDGLRGVIEEQTNAIEAGHTIEYIRLDNEFHHRQFRISGHTLYLDIITTFNSHYDRIRNLTTWDYANVKNSIRQHQEILCHLEQGELEQAQNLLKDHLTKLENEKQSLFEHYPDYFTVQR